MKGAVPVWGLGIRLLHWMLAVGIASAWYWASDVGDRHAAVGYAVAAIILLRMGWGSFCGPRSARLSRCLRAPRLLRSYIGRTARRQKRRYLGHNPLGSLMVLTLLGVAAGVCLTGWLYTTDWFWGYGWLAQLHRSLAWVLGALIATHIAGVFLTSRLERQNLVSAMITGRKRRRSARGAIHCQRGDV